jgi:hypothetical protein
MTNTGDGLSVLILCDYIPIHNWMTFACWYSLSKILPDSKIGIMCNRRPVTWQMFDWTRRLRVNMQIHAPLTKEQNISKALAGSFYSKPLLVLEPNILAIRDLENLEGVQEVTDVASSDLCSDVRGDKMSPFVSYSDGWGNFVVSSWINRAGSPFRHKFGRENMTVNEVRVERLWGQLATVFQTVSRG